VPAGAQDRAPPWAQAGFATVLTVEKDPDKLIANDTVFGYNYFSLASWVRAAVSSWLVFYLLCLIQHDF